MRDFDHIVDASRPVRYQMGGAEYALPPEIPAPLVLYMEDLAKTRGRDAPFGGTDLVTAVRLLVGDETLDRWLDAGVGLERLGAFFSWAMEEYGPEQIRNEPEEDEKSDDSGNG